MNEENSSDEMTGDQNFPPQDASSAIPHGDSDNTDQQTESEKKPEATYTPVNDYYQSEGIWNKLVAAPLNAMNSPEYFKKGFKALLTLASIVIFIAGVWHLCSELFGDFGYIEKMKSYSTMVVIRSIIASLFAFVLSGVVIFVMSGFLWKRANDLRENDENALIFILTRLLKLAGEMCAIWPVALSLFSLISMIFVAIPYMPLNGFFAGTQAFYDYTIAKYLGIHLGVGSFDNGYYLINTFGDYVSVFFKFGLFGIIKGFIIAFVNLFAFYLIADIIEVVFKFLTRGNK